MLSLLPSKPIYVLAANRTPVGRFKGTLAQYSPIQLGAAAIQGAVKNSGINPEHIPMTIMGMVSTANLGQAPARNAALEAGLPKSMASRTVNTVCGSAMEAITQTMEAILAGVIHGGVAGGMESKTQTPYLLPPYYFRNAGEYTKGERIEMKMAGAYRWSFKEINEALPKAIEIIDGASYDGLFWAPEKKFMAEYAKKIAKHYQMTAESINEYAQKSHAKAREATQQGWFDKEIIPVGDQKTDDLLTDEKIEKIMEREQGAIISAYNTSTPADAGAALVLGDESFCNQTQQKPIAEILGYARLDVPAEDFLEAPIHAANELYSTFTFPKEHWTLIEANEAFGIQLPLFEKNFSPATVNIHGGAIALGHPLGAAGARLTTTLIHAMHTHNHEYGMVALCYGGGGAYALALKRL